MTETQSQPQVQDTKSELEKLKEEFREQIRAKDEQINKLIELAKEPKVEALPEQDTANVLSMYDALHIEPKTEYTEEEAENEFQKMIGIMREVKGTPSEQLVGGTEPNDMGAAEMLHARGVIKTLADFRRVRSEAAKYEQGIF